MPTDTRGNAKAVTLGPGQLFIADLGSTEPAGLDDAWPALWTSLGYTEEGSAFAYELTTEGVPVAEELEDLDDVTTGRNGSVTFALAEVTAENLKVALNGGTITAVASNGTTIIRAHKTFEPPALGQEVYKMIGFESEDTEERWVWRQCKQTGAIEMQRRKGATKTTINATFKMFKPAAGGAPFKAYIADSRTV